MTLRTRVEKLEHRQPAAAEIHVIEDRDGERTRCECARCKPMTDEQYQAYHEHAHATNKPGYTLIIVEYAEQWLTDAA